MGWEYQDNICGKVSAIRAIRGIVGTRVGQTPQVAGLVWRVDGAFQFDRFRARFGSCLVREAGPYGGDVKYGQC